MKLKLIGTTLVALFTLSAVWAGDGAKQGSETNGDKLDFLLGGGVVISPEYKDFTDDAYPGYDGAGGYGWLGLYLGLEYKVTPQFSVIGGSDLWFNTVDVSGGALDETYLNLLVLPSVYAQYYFTAQRNFYVNGGISLPLPYTGSENYEFNGKGVGFGGNVGFAFGTGKSMRLELGYLIVPVETKATASNPVLAGSEDYNFGGFQLRFLGAF